MKKDYLVGLCFILLLPISVLPQNLKFEEKMGVINLYNQQNPRFSYQKETKSLNGLYPRANYVHPLYGLNGEVLTEEFPEDHFHHRGIFWSLHQLYVNNKRIADRWFCEGIKRVVDSITTLELAHSRIRYSNSKTFLY